MTLGLLLLLAASAVAGGTRHHVRKMGGSYETGNDYVYHYEGHVASGIPQISKHYGGLKVAAKVTLQFRDSADVLMKLDHIRVYKIDSLLSTSPSEPLTESEASMLSGEQATVIKHALAHPLKFRWDEGEIRHLEFERRDEFWSRNVKKGIVSMLQLNLNEMSSPSELQNARGVNSLLRVSARRSRSSRLDSTQSRLFGRGVQLFSTVYKVMEADVTGECETKYIVNSTKRSTDKSHIFVTTVRNFDNCRDTRHHVEGLFAGVYADPSEKDLIRPSIHTDFVITGDLHNFVIKNVRRRGEYQFMPQGADGGDLSAYTFQELKLVGSEPGAQPINVGPTEVDSDGLRLTVPSSSSGWTHDSTSDTANTDDFVAVVDKKLDELIDCMYPSSVDKSCTLLVLKLSRLMRSLPTDALRSLVDKYVATEDDDQTTLRKREMLLDTMATTPTPEVAAVMLRLVREYRLTGFRASVMINTMSLVTNPTPYLISTTKEVYDALTNASYERMKTFDGDVKTGQLTMVRKALLLAVGTLYNRLLPAMTRNVGKKNALAAVAELIPDMMTSELERAGSEEEQELILKAIGNMGSPDPSLMATVKTIIDDKTLPTKQRLNAIYALRRLARLHSKQVSPTLLNVYMNSTEPVRVRIGAFSILRNTMPSYMTLQAVAHRLKTEPSLQLRTFVYSTLVGMAQYGGSEPDRKRTAKDARLVLKLMSPVTVGVHDSVSLTMQKYDENSETGASLNIIKLKSKMSGLVDALVANIQGTMLGKHRHLAEFGIEGRGMDTVLRRLVGPHGILKEIIKGTMSIKDLVKPLAQQTNMDGLQNEIKQIMSQMLDEEFLASWYVHILSNELQYSSFTIDNIDSVVDKVMDSLPSIARQLINGYKLDALKTLSLVNSLVLPTPLGIPLTLNHTCVGVFKVSGEVKLNSNWAVFIFQRSLADKIRLDVDVQPSLQMRMIASIGVDMRWMTAGAAFMMSTSAQMPLKFEVALDRNNHQLTVKKYLPGTTTKVFMSKVEPMTFIEYVPTTVSKLPFRVDMSQMKMESFVKRVEFQRSWQDKLTGIEHIVIGQSYKCGPAWCPRFPLYGKHEISLTLRPKTRSDFVTLRLLPGTADADADEQWQNDDSTQSASDQSETTWRWPWQKAARDAGRNSRRHQAHQNEDAELRSDDFTPVKVDPMFTHKPYSRCLLVSLGSSHAGDNKVKAKLTAFVDRQQWLKNQLNIQVISDVEHRFRLNFDHACDPSSMSHQLSTPHGGEFLEKLHVRWSVDDRQKHVHIKIVPGDRTVNINEKLAEQGLVSATSQLTSQLKYKFTVEAEFSNMSRTMLKYRTMMLDLMKHELYDYVTVAIPTQPSANKIIIATEFIPSWEKMTMIVKTDNEIDTIVDAPFYWNPFFPKHVRLNLHDQPRSYRSNSTEFNYSPYEYTTAPNFYLDESSRICTFNSEHVTTFDGLTIPTWPLSKTADSDCEVLVVAAPDLFAVVRTGSSRAPGLRFVLYAQKIEWTWSGRTWQVRTNGEHTEMHSSRPIVVHREPSDASSEIVYTIEKTDGEGMKLEAPQLGLTVLASGAENQIKIKLSPTTVLHGRLVGVCGNYNQDRSDELSEYRGSRSSFLMSNGIPSETCTKKMLDTHREDDDDENDESCVVKERVTIRRHHEGTDLICTSDEPVDRCRSACQSPSDDQWAWSKVCFTCRTTDVRSRIFTAGQRERDSTCPNFEQFIRVPTECIAD